MSRFLLRDVLAQESLGLRLITPPDDAALDRLVMGAHGTEALHPVPWLQRDWVLLITGVRLVGRPDLQRRLVEELAEGRLAALGFGVGIDFETVPQPLLEAAAACGFPVFEIPLRTPFREIINFVNRSLLSTDLHFMRRLTSMREFLISAMQEPDPQGEIVQRMASLLDSSVALFALDGSVEAAAGPIPPAELRPCLGSADDDEPPAVRGRPPLRVPIRDRDLVRSSLIAVPGPAGSANRYARSLLETAALLLGSLAGLRRITGTLQRSVHAAFVGEFLGEAGEEDAIRRHHAAALGLDLEAGPPLRGVVLAPPEGLGDRGVGADRALAEAEGVLLRLPVSAVLAERGGQVIGLVQGEHAELLDRMASLSARLPGWTMGVGRPVASTAGLRSSLVDALHAAAREPGKMHRFEDLDLLTWLLTTADQGGLRAKAEEIVALIEGDEVLLESLWTYLDHNLNVIRAAKPLNIHPNSLRYRLGRIEERLGRSLADPETIALLYVVRRALSDL